MKKIVILTGAGLLYYVPFNVPKYLVDPKAEPEMAVQNLKIIREKASIGVPSLADELGEIIQSASAQLNLS